MPWKRGVFALFAVAAGTNVPTPLLLLYRDRFGLSNEVLTAVREFALPAIRTRMA